MIGFLDTTKRGTLAEPRAVGFDREGKWDIPFPAD